MAKTKKTVRKGLSYLSCDDFAAYLNHMARQGWHFTGWRAGLVFEKGEPEDSVYAVEVFSQASEYDVRPEPQTEEFAEYCEAAGWRMIDARRKFVVFKRTRPDAVPIMTDPERFENIAKAEAPDQFRVYSLALVWFLMKLFEFNTAFEYRIFSPIDLFSMWFWMSLLLLGVIRYGQFLLWKHRCRRRLKEDKRLFFGNGRQSFSGKWYDLLRDLILISAMGFFVLMGLRQMVLVLLGIGAAMWLMGYLIARFRPDSDTNSAIQVLFAIALLAGLLIISPFLDQRGSDLFYQVAEPPLTYGDMGIDLGQPEVLYSREQESIFGHKQYANLDYGYDYLFYSIYDCESDWVLDKLWQEETKGKRFDTRYDCTDAWGAEEAFYNSNRDYVIRYDDALWVISLSLEEPLTQEQIDAVISIFREG